MTVVNIYNKTTPVLFETLLDGAFALPKTKCDCYHTQLYLKFKTTFYTLYGILFFTLPSNQNSSRLHIGIYRINIQTNIWYLSPLHS